MNKKDKKNIDIKKSLKKYHETQEKKAEVNEGEVLKKVSDTILQRPIDFKIKVDKQNILHKLGILPKERTFIIYPIKLGALFQISKIIQQMKQGKVNLERPIIDVATEMMVNDKDNIIRIIAYAINNSPQNPGYSLLKFLENNLTCNEIFKIWNVVFQQMNIRPFVFTITQMKEANLLNKSRNQNQSQKKK